MELTPQIITNLIQVGVTGVFCVIFWLALNKRTDQFIKLHEDSLKVQSLLTSEVKEIKEEVQRLPCRPREPERQTPLAGRERSA